jgi:hypothetical protein
LQAHRERDQLLVHAVVEGAFDSPSIVVPGPDQSLSGRTQLVDLAP